MTFNLGRAQFIIDADGDPILAETAKTYNEVTKRSQELSKQLAKEEQVRISDVKNAASVIIQERRREAAEVEKIAKQEADNRKRTTQELMRYEQQQFKEREARNAKARQIQKEETAIEQRRIQTVRATVAEEKRIRLAAFLERQKQATTPTPSPRGEPTTRGGSGGGIPLLGSSPGGVAATLLGFGAIASGAVILREAIVSVTDATKNHEQAQRSLNAAFGQSQGVFKAHGEALAQQFKRVNSEVIQATTRFGILQNQSTLTSAEIKQLQGVAIDLQSAFGGDLQEAFRSVAGAILGETEALEKYNIVLQEGVLKSSDLLTESEKRRFTTMSESEKQAIRLRALFELAGSSMGAAAQRSKDVQGGFDALNRSADELAKTIGGALIPQTSSWARTLAGALDIVNEAFQRHAELLEASAELTMERGRPIDVTSPEVKEEIRQRAAQIKQRHDAIKQLQDANEKAAIANKDLDQKEKERVDKENTRIKEQGELYERQLREAAKQEQRRLDEAIRAAEERKTYELRALEERKDAELKAVEETENARKNAAELELARIETEKDTAIRASDEQLKNELERINTEQEAIKAVAEEQIRQLEIQKDRELQIAEDLQEAELARLEAEDTARNNARTEEDRGLEDAVRDRQRKLDNEHKQNVHRFELEAEAANDAHKKVVRDIDERQRKEEKRQQKADEHHARTLRNIERRSDKEDERHRKAIRNIEDESDKQLDAIDAQLRGIDRVRDAREAERRSAELSRKASDARLNLVRAQGTGSPQEIEAARSKLTSAIRIQDPEAVRKAQEELIEISGQGTKAVEEAQRDLFDVEQALRDNSVENAEDAERQKFEDVKRLIQQQTELDKRAEEDRSRRRKKELDEDKRANDDRARSRRDSIESEREAARKQQEESQRQLEIKLREIERRKEAEQEAHENTKQQAEDETENLKRQIEDRRRAEDEAHKLAIQATNANYENTREQIDRTYNSEEVGLIPAIRRATAAVDTGYKTQETAARNAHEATRLEIYNTYDHPETGLIAVHRRAEKDATDTHKRIKDNIAANYDEARQAVSDSYNHPDGKSGIIDKLRVLKEETENKLNDSITLWENWQKGLVGPEGKVTKTFEEATRQMNDFFDALQRRGAVTITPTIRVRPIPGIQQGPDPGMPGSVSQGDGSGIGTATPPVTTTAPSGPPDPEATRPNVSIPADDVGNRFNVSFGYAQPYSGGYTPGPGWSGGAAWAGGPSHHKGVDLIIPGAPRNGYGLPVPAFHAGRVLRTVADSSGPGGNMVVIDDGSGRTHWYLHLKGYSVRSGQTVNRGDIIATLGDTGTEEFPHLHYEVRMGDNNGPMSLDALRRNGIDPMTFVRGRDQGYTFRNPTLYRDMRTGEEGVLAERGAERLLGRRQTQQFDSMGLTARLNATPLSPATTQTQMDYSAIGAALSGMSTTVVNQGGDNFHYDGVAPDSIFRDWRADQRRQRVLRGRR